MVVGGSTALAYGDARRLLHSSESLRAYLEGHTFLPRAARWQRYSPIRYVASERSRTLSEQPRVAGRQPQVIELEEGKNYAWCYCGQSANQPFCDGSHAGTDFKPHVFKAEKSGRAALCMCKQTGNVPLCDGTHASLDP